MPLLNDMARCEGWRETKGQKVVSYCPRRRECARYVERRQGGPRTGRFAYICMDGVDEYLPVEKPNDH